MLKVSPLQHFCNALTRWYSANSESVADVAVENKNFLVQRILPKVVAYGEKGPMGTYQHIKLFPSQVTSVT